MDIKKIRKDALAFAKGELKETPDDIQCGAEMCYFNGMVYIYRAYIEGIMSLDKCKSLAQDTYYIYTKDKQLFDTVEACLEYERMRQNGGADV